MRRPNLHHMKPSARDDNDHPIAVCARAAPSQDMDELSQLTMTMRTGAWIPVNKTLIAVYQAASSSHSVRALKTDLATFALWCRHRE